MRSSWHDGDLVTDPERAALHDVGPQPAPVLERLSYSGARQALEVRTRRGGADAAQHDITDAERRAHEMMQRDAFGHEVPAGLVLGELDTALVVHGGDHLALHERDLAAVTAAGRVDAGPVGVGGHSQLRSRHAHEI